MIPSESTHCTLIALPAAVWPVSARTSPSPRSKVSAAAAAVSRSAAPAMASRSSARAYSDPLARGWRGRPGRERERPTWCGSRESRARWRACSSRASGGVARARLGVRRRRPGPLGGSSCARMRVVLDEPLPRDARGRDRSVDLLQLGVGPLGDVRLERLVQKFDLECRLSMVNGSTAESFRPEHTPAASHPCQSDRYA